MAFKNFPQHLEMLNPKHCSGLVCHQPVEWTAANKADSADAMFVYIRKCHPELPTF
jgi:hypothetical protein